jgi:hypothetical protein
VALHRHPWSQVRPGVQRLAVSLLSKKGSGGYTAGGVPVTGALPELGLLNLPPLECRRVALHRHPWSQVRPGVQRLGRFVSRGPWRRPAGDQVFSYSLSVGAGIGVAVGVVGFKSARNGGRVEPERSFVNCVDAADLRIAAPGRLGPPRLRNALAVQARKSQSDLVGLHRPGWTRRPWGGLGRSQRCTGRVADSDSHWQCRFRRPVALPQAPALPRRRLRVQRSGRPNASFATKAPPRDPGRQTRARCVRRAAPWRRASNSAPPPSLGRAPIPPDSSISKSGPRNVEFQYPVVVLNIERARYKIVTPGESSATEGCSRRGFALASR